MKATIRAYVGITETFQAQLILDPRLGTITIGRGEDCSYPITSALGVDGDQMSLIQASIIFEGDQILLQDGDGGVSETGVFHYAQKISSPITLISGLELTLYKKNTAKITLVISDNVLAVLKQQIDSVNSQIVELHKQVQVLSALGGQVDALGSQIIMKGQIDAAQNQHQNDRLQQTESRVNQVLTALFLSTAAIVLGVGFLGSGSTQDQKQWSTGLISGASVIAGIYFKIKEAERNAKIPSPTLPPAKP